MGMVQLLNGGIQEGAFCTTQAIVMQIANFAGAYFIIAIGIHTFNSLVLARRQSPWVCGITISVGWIVSGVLAPMLYHNPEFGPRYGISGLSCGIRPVFPKSLFFFHLLPIYITSIMSALLYSIIFLVLRGTLAIRGGLKLTLDPNERMSGNNYHRFVAAIARSMLWFPIAYILFLVPYSVARLIDIAGRVCPFPLLVSAYVCWFMLGVANVLTLYNTFRVLGPAFDARSTSQKDLESNTGSTGSSTRRVMPPMIAAGEREYSYHPSESMSEKSSRPNSLASWNQVQPASSENYGAPFQLMAPPLAARIQERREEYTNELQRTHTRTNSERSDWTVTTPSFYDYGVTPDTASGPRPKTQLSQLLLNEPAVNGAPSRVRTSRRLPPLAQAEPAQGLPAPPRSVRQVASQRSVTVSLNSPHDSVEVRFSSTSATSAAASELDISGWLNQQRPDGYMPRGLISAVGNNHSVPPIPADVVPVPERSGSMDIARSRSAIAASDRKRIVRQGEQNRPRNNSSPEPPNFF
ncbi:hypothetical protein B0H17DRAFT_106346 [Mycena rosella]|uniref:G-protein coupled receptors family 1 profile domain-containing protein n=1 Tax=Mycena rosella TaxID=1033263 RepID=A0AAD7D4J3_MYCRO|nr:hypothetical protein B0H17DRAFT_106346 [Mycena rosella]